MSLTRNPERPSAGEGRTRPRGGLVLLATLAGAGALQCKKSEVEPSHGAVAAKEAAHTVATSEAPPTPRPRDFRVAESIYDGALLAGWQDWGWGKHELGGGPARIDMSSYGGLILNRGETKQSFGALVFRMRAPAAYGQFLQVKLAHKELAFPVRDVTAQDTVPLADGWVEILVPFAELNPRGLPFDQVILHAWRLVGAEPVLFDKIALTAVDPAEAERRVANAPIRDAPLVIDCGAPGHAISPFIYGIGGAEGAPSALGATARRWGGNLTSRYNWENGAYNLAHDWFFANVQAPSHRAFLQDNARQGAISALTIPLLGWVAKDTVSVGFPVSVLGPQQAHDPHRPEAGNGLDSGGKPIKAGPPERTSAPSPPSHARRWVEQIRAEDAKSGTRSVHMYILDNEPSLWNTTHRDVRAEPLSYDELLDRSLRYGAAIREVDPSAVIAGPAEWGWTGYFYSAKDMKSGATLRPDRRAHGDVPLVPWYLSKLRAHEQATGRRILDVLDLHFYPQGQGVHSNASDPATAALRIRSTRSLWDPTYKDESWIDDTVRLVPRLKEWVASSYPGLKTSIGEYNFGGEGHMSGALALAEALGRFGTEGLDYAFYWTFPPKDSPAAQAFLAYRSFDGKGARFLDRSVPTSMASDVSLFASRDEKGERLVAVALNFDPEKAARARVELRGCGPASGLRRFAYGPHTPVLRDEGARPAGAAFEEVLPPYSIVVFDVALARRP